MVFDKRVEVLTLREGSPGVWEWIKASEAWTAISPQKGTNLFSKVGLGARSVLFSMHPRRLSLHQAIRYRGQHFFLTSIHKESPVMMEVLTARVGCANCTASRLPDGPGEDKRAVRTLALFASFPAVLTEKYQGYDQKPAMAQVAQTYVLVTPKPIVLRPGDLVEVCNVGAFVVHVCHTLDDFKNEYEIHRKEDA